MIVNNIIQIKIMKKSKKKTKKFHYWNLEYYTWKN